MTSVSTSFPQLGPDSDSLIAQPFDALPTELIVRILLKLPFKTLLCRVSRLSKRFRAIVQEDPELGVVLFKRASKVFVERVKGEGERGERGRAVAKHARKVEEEAETFRLHPALNSVSYTLGANADSAGIWVGDPAHPVLVSLSDCCILNDFVSIPALTRMELTVPRGTLIHVFEHLSHPYDVVVENPRGVKLGDVFRELEKESNVVVPRHGATRAKLLDLEGSIFYQGIHDLKRTGLVLKGIVHVDGI
ncbi:hypothetical protein HMN09_01089200 [Mycena chlorophos]|uniref:F-box domain-containing protein n=1 Tax=Mycena chlorophos TaxID=658473 RepID=A0A8H6SCH3_MYCCL|nr:hypothetical protein HMN09_01089200 [Mycena chlorophos]